MPKLGEELKEKGRDGTTELAQKIMYAGQRVGGLFQTEVDVTILVTPKDGGSDTIFVSTAHPERFRTMIGDFALAAGEGYRQYEESIAHEEQPKVVLQ